MKSNSAQRPGSDRRVRRRPKEQSPAPNHSGQALANSNATSSHLFALHISGTTKPTEDPATLGGSETANEIVHGSGTGGPGSATQGLLFSANTAGGPFPEIADHAIAPD